MTDGIRVTPAHRRKHLQGFADVRSGNDQASERADELQDSAERTTEPKCRPHTEKNRRDRRDGRFR